MVCGGGWCRALEIEPTATRRLDDDEKMTLRLTQGGSKRTSETNIINEPGLYSLVLGNKKAEARTSTKFFETKFPKAIDRMTPLYYNKKCNLLIEKHFSFSLLWYHKSIPLSSGFVRFFQKKRTNTKSVQTSKKTEQN
ncbi:BRO family protein [uncultured Oscillibacter sp.]|uniref:BRO-N domain-containing protein n=1 Tax=uncultured Oscillibacter sp. TaxID=876091 RepID=UPI002607194A|nr:BRO family protein [uncultured Oscillibacter sp.]